MENKTQKRIFSVIFLSLVVFFSSANILFAENEQLKNVSDNSNMQEKYINILEKTNQQLSLFWNPYNTILTILTVLFAIFTIIFGAILYFQGKDYKQKIDEFFKEQREYAKKLMDKYKIDLETKYNKYNEKILELEEKRKALPKEQKQKIEEIEKSIEELKTKKELFKSQIDFIPPPAPTDFDFSNISVLGGTNFHRCSHCGFGFKTKDYNCNNINNNANLVR